MKVLGVTELPRELLNMSLPSGRPLHLELFVLVMSFFKTLKNRNLHIFNR